MRRSGPAPDPAEFQEAKGNPSKKPKKAHPRAASGMPDPPAWLSKSALALWKEAGPILETMGHLTVADGQVLARYCDALVRWADLTKRLDELKREDSKSAGLVMTFQTGARQVAAELSAYMKLASLLDSLEQELGLTPAARTRLTTWAPSSPTPKPKGDSEGGEEKGPPAFRFTGETG